VVHPKVGYAGASDGKLAYQVVGDGPIDVLFHPTAGWNLDMVWDHPVTSRFLRRLSSFCRLLLMTARGTAMSDPIRFAAFTAEEWGDDVNHVIDAAGSERVAYVASHDICPLATLWAARYPERASSLVLLDGYATLRLRDDYPFGFRDDILEQLDETVVAQWGTGEALQVLAPEFAGDADFVDWYARLERGTASPFSIRSIRNVFRNLDIRGILSNVQVPVLVVEHTEDPYIRLGHGRYLAEHIPTARYVERPGFWGLPWLHDVDWTLEELQSFLTGSRESTVDTDRVLATVLFTDIVGSTQQAAQMGDERWTELLGVHDSVARVEVERFHGEMIKHTGDGLLATFDGPGKGIRCARSLASALRPFGIEVRAGLHTGELERRGGDLHGIAVHIGARVMHAAGAGEVLVSAAVPPLVAGSGIDFTDRGEHELKGVPGTWKLFAVSSHA
jgi:class 3 adenylate cyclase/pimeloyl-ACP methyl ester carboxylesterase